MASCTTTGSLGSCSESSREFLPARFFPDAVVISVSHTKRGLYGGQRSRYRGERCVGSGSQPGHHPESKTHSASSASMKFNPKQTTASEGQKEGRNVGGRQFGSPGILQPSAELRFAQVHRFQRQAPGYRRKFVAAPNSLFAKSRFEDSPHGWNK